MNPQQHIAKAERALASARLLLDDGDADGACNRAYYAMFDAAQAALLELGGTACKTHRGLIGAFGMMLVKPGRISIEMGRSLNQVEHIRLLADYTGEAIDQAQGQWAVEQAAQFVCEIRAGQARRWQPIQGGEGG